MASSPLNCLRAAFSTLHVAAVAAKFASDRGLAARFLSLNDPQVLHGVRVDSLEFSVFGYARRKAQF